MVDNHCVTSNLYFKIEIDSCLSFLFSFHCIPHQKEKKTNHSHLFIWIAFKPEWTMITAAANNLPLIPKVDEILERFWWMINPRSNQVKCHCFGFEWIYHYDISYAFAWFQLVWMCVISIKYWEWTINANTLLISSHHQLLWVLVSLESVHANTIHTQTHIP